LKVIEIINNYWDTSEKVPKAFFHTPGESWFWTGHGIMIKEKLIVFLMKVRGIQTGLGFESFSWSVVSLDTPRL